MMGLAIDIADAVAAEINAAADGTFSQVVDAQRQVLPARELSELTTLKVTVVPKAIEISGSTRSVSQYDVAIDIGVQKKLGKDLDVEVSPLMTLVDEIAEYLRKRQLAAAPYAAWVRTANDPVYVPEHLASQRVFTSLLTVTYRAMR